MSHHPALDVRSNGRDAAPRILLAEDDPEMRRMLAGALEAAGYRVAPVAGGFELLFQLLAASHDALAPPGPFDLVISDVRMPGLDGLEVIAGLRADDWAMPVIMITAFGDDATHAEAHRLGAAVLDKPFDLSALLLAVERVVPSRHLA